MEHQALLKNLWARTKPADECLIWTGGIDKDGYGKVYRLGRHWRAHRLVWFLHHGPIDSGLVVCHTCDTSGCINIEHLFLGTVADNNADKVAKGRERGPNRDKKFCKRNHEFTPENTDYITSGRRCRACRKIRKN